MKLTKDEVENIANLARIELTGAEISKFQGDLTVILEYVEKLKEVDTEGVEETLQVTESTNVTRADEVETSDMRDGILQNAPNKHEDYFKVKKVL